MNFFNKQKQNIKSISFLFTGLAFIACTFDDESDPNRPSLEGVLSEATVNQLNNLVVGVEATMRAGKAGQPQVLEQWLESCISLMLIQETPETF